MSSGAIALVFLAIFGCSTLEREPNVFYLGSGSGVRTVRITNEWLTRLHAQWTPASNAVSRTTKLADTDRKWVLDFIALNVETFEKCKMSDLRTVTLRQLGTEITDGDKRSQPSRYNEAWSVDSCGQLKEWLVYDTTGNLVVSPNKAP